MGVLIRIFPNHHATNLMPYAILLQLGVYYIPHSLYTAFTFMLIMCSFAMEFWTVEWNMILLQENVTFILSGQNTQ